MSRKALAIVLLLFAVPAAADVGIGASLSSDSRIAYLPLNLWSRFRLEPYLRAQKLESRASSPDTQNPPGDFSSDAQTLGVGIFGQSSPRDRVSIYYGARLAYERRESDVISLVLGPASPFIEPPTQRRKSDGYTIVPTLGLEYFFTDRLSIGAEVGWEYTELDDTITRTDTSGDVQTITTETDTQDTQTNIVLRFYF